MPYSDALDVRITDSSLRDGSHAKSHQFTEAHVSAIVGGLAAVEDVILHAEDGRDGIAHFVSQAGRQSSDRGQAL